MKPAYKRILLKLSGEALMGKGKFGIDAEACHKITSSVQEIFTLGLQIGIVIGGGNIFRGSTAKMERIPADHIGMLATLMNAIALSQAFQRLGVPNRILSAISVPPLAEGYTWRGTLKSLHDGEVVIFAGGTGNPYFTTDTAAALRASEIQADILFKATKVDGIYNKDPLKYPDASKFDRVTYSEVLSGQLQVMDAAAIALCRENRLPIRVFDMFADHALRMAVCGQPIGTLVEGE